MQALLAFQKNAPFQLLQAPNAPRRRSMSCWLRTKSSSAPAAWVSWIEKWKWIEDKGPASTVAKWQIFGIFRNYESSNQRSHQLYQMRLWKTRKSQRLLLSFSHGGRQWSWSNHRKLWPGFFGSKGVIRVDASRRLRKRNGKRKRLSFKHSQVTSLSESVYDSWLGPKCLSRYPTSTSACLQSSWLESHLSEAEGLNHWKF